VNPAAATASLTAWSRGHAVAMLVACALAMLLERAWPVSLLALGTVAVLLLAHRGAYTPGGRFGAANAVTAARLALALIVGLAPADVPGPMMAAALTLVWALDGLDGWLARRDGLASTFGATFDMETDALLVLIADVQLWQRGRFGAWVLITGLLRYTYVLALALRPAPTGHVPRSRFGRAAFLALVVGLTAGFAWDGAAGTWLAALGAAAVTVSFTRSFLWSYRRRS
jgi:phosphatidylglycerophosphate synthase